ncbi:MAG: TIGR00282 family metallophosphoesterase [Eubacteriales bacterium]
MIFNLLAIGDVVGEPSVDYLQSVLPSLKKEHDIHMTVANGENISGLGITPAQARSLFASGADVITLGNHTWNRIQISDFLDSNPHIIRPANYAGRTPGRGLCTFESDCGVRVCVLNLMGRLNLNANLDSPFQAANRLLRDLDCDITVVDFHAEASSEKGAMGWHLDGRVSAVWGTHTHVPTADTKILPKGTGFVSDLGMTGPLHSVLGIRPDHSLNLFTGAVPRKFAPAEGPLKMESCIFSIDTDTRKCVSVKRLDIHQ